MYVEIDKPCFVLVLKILASLGYVDCSKHVQEGEKHQPLYPTLNTWRGNCQVQGTNETSKIFYIEMISGIQKSCKNSTNNLNIYNKYINIIMYVYLYLHPSSPSVNISHICFFSHFSFIYVCKLLHWCLSIPKYFSVHFLKTKHFLTKPQCNDQNQEINIETILVYRIYSVLSLMSFIQNKNYFLIQNPIQDQTLRLLVMSVVSFNLDWFLTLPLSSKCLTFGKSTGQLFCRIFLHLGLLFPHDSIQLLYF